MNNKYKTRQNSNFIKTMEISSTNQFYDESALEWYQRANHFQKSSLIHPIQFPTRINATIHPTINGQDLSQLPPSSAFPVNSDTMSWLSELTFLLQYDYVESLKERLRIWRKFRKQQNTTTTCLLGNQHITNNKQKLNWKEEEESSKRLEDILLDSLPLGTGLSFINLVLQNHNFPNKQHAPVHFNSGDRNVFVENTYNEYNELNHFSSPFRNQLVCLEIIGNRDTPKSLILCSLAANYAASTSWTFLDSIIPSSSPPSSLSKPLVIIFDPEYNIHASILLPFIRAALLKRWSSTETFRKALSTHYGNNDPSSNYNHSIQSSDEKLSNHGNFSYQHQGQEENNMNEHSLLELELENVLKRIHILHPKDFRNGYIPILEVLFSRQLSTHESINMNKNKSKLFPRESSTLQSHKQKSPTARTMLLFDSLFSSFEPTDKMFDSLPRGSGLSGRNEFIRQLQHLQSQGEVTIVATKHNSSSKYSNHHDKNSFCNISGSNIFTPMKNTIEQSWENLITHRIEIQHTKKGTKEELEGFEFVALLHNSTSFFPNNESSNLHKDNNDSAKNPTVRDDVDVWPEKCWTNVTPFSINSDGILS